jgi:hypothetical protein
MGRDGRSGARGREPDAVVRKTALRANDLLCPGLPASQQSRSQVGAAVDVTPGCRPAFAGGRGGNAPDDR